MKHSEVLELELVLTKAMEEEEDQPWLRELSDEKLGEMLTEATVKFVVLWREANRR